MSVKLKEYSWYNFDKISSFNCVQNYIVGSRGEGKTYGAIKRAIAKHLRTGEQFVYIRRTDKELQNAIGSFFNAIELKNEFPNHDFRTITDKAEGGQVGQITSRSTRGEKKRAWKTIMYFIPLSRAQAFKSSNYPLVTTMIYDEFIKEKGYTHYLPNEFEAFMGLFQTIDRNQDKTTVFFLANAVTIMNPYFIALNIQPDLQREYGKYAKADDGSYYVAVHISDNKDFKEAVGNTRYAKFINGTAFGEYALGNTFADSNQELIRKKTSEAEYRYTLETKTGAFAVWRDFDLDLFFIQARRPKVEKILTMVSENMSDSKLLVTPTNKLIASLRTAYVHGRAYFDKASTRNTFAEVFKN